LCDGHEFHERSKLQASRDKGRDRALLIGGNPVMRFTGSEIWKDTTRCATDVDRYFQGADKE
jgi:very-short-patch-repair endonuclease